MGRPQSSISLVEEADVEKAWPTPDGTPSREGARDKEARDKTAQPDPRFGRRTINPAIRPAHPAKDNRAVIDRPSVGRSLRRAVYRFILAVLVGVSGTLGWQSYGEQVLGEYAPTLAWMFSIPAAKLRGAAATLSDTTQATPLPSNMDALRRSLEQLSAKQDQMAQDIAKLQAIEDDIRQNMSYTPMPVTAPQATTSALQPRLPQPKVQPSAVPRPATALTR
jgi:hypothetical protein